MLRGRIFRIQFLRALAGHVLQPVEARFEFYLLRLRLLSLHRYGRVHLRLRPQCGLVTRSLEGERPLRSNRLCGALAVEGLELAQEGGEGGGLGRLVLFGANFLPLHWDRVGPVLGYS